MLSTNQVLNQGRYRIIHHVGPSDNSGLYQAYDTVSNANVVLKETEGSAVSTATKALSDLKHNSLLNVRDYFSELDRQYIVIESTDGQDLAELLAGNGKAPAVSDVVKWADNLLDALNYLHTHRPPVLHGDIKPENIRLTSSFEIKLLSPAVSRDRDDEFAVSAMADTASLPYRSLEQLWEGLDAASRKVIANSFDEASEEILREEPDERADLYALAATLYHALTKVAPADAMARTLEILDGNDDPMQPAYQLDGKIPKAVSDVIMKALEIRRENRFDSASAMHAALRSAAGDMAKSAKNEAASAAQAAEQKRLEEQRKAEEAKKLAAEAEEKQLAETRAEQKRQKLEAEQKLRDEIAAQEKAAAQQATPVKEDLLELPEGVDTEPVQELDGADILAEAFDEKPKAKAASASYSSTDYNPMFSEPTSGGGMSKMPIIIGAAVVVLAVIIGGWMFMGSAGGSQATPSQTTLSSDAAKTAPAVTEEAPQTTAPAVAEQAPTETESKPSADQPAKNEAVKSQAKAKKEEKTEAKPTATPKKAVTADDIMHDN